MGMQPHIAFWQNLSHYNWLSWSQPIRLRFWFAATGQSSGDDNITHVAAYDEEAALQSFYELFARYQKPIADFLFRMTHDHDWAADLTQDTFLKAYSHRGDLASITNVRAWLYRIAANTANNALRHQRRFAWVSLSELGSGDSSDQRSGVIVAASGDLATNVVERDALVSALSTLTPVARSVILLRATAGFDTVEISEMLGLSESNTRKILYRAKEKLRQSLVAMDPGAGEGRI
jgi:RNA polymerase sigma-70 factor (ECF subfamily)